MSKVDNTDSECGSVQSRLYRRGFLRNRDGATVVEFALLALPFTLLIFAIIESCISFAAQERMQNVTDDVARLFRTGQIQPGEMDQQEFRAMMCDRLEMFVGSDCMTDTKLKIDLRQFTTYQQAADATTYVDRTDELTLSNGFQFDPGRAQTINMLRVYYDYPVMTDLLRGKITNRKGLYVLHTATATWQNEPFPDEIPGAGG